MHLKEAIDRFQRLVPTFHTNKMVKEKETEQAHLCVGFEGLPIGHKDVYNLIVMNNILWRKYVISDYFRRYVRKKDWLTLCFPTILHIKTAVLVTIYGGTGASQMDELFDTIQSTLATLKTDGITSKELNNSKEQLKGNLMLSLESTNSRMSRNGRNELLLGKHRYIGRHCGGY